MMITRRVYVLVKAYPQPSEKYGETVCCAGISDKGEFVRLYPVRYRRLRDDQRFDRYDLLEVKGTRPKDDHRPESFHVEEDSIRVVKKNGSLKTEAKAKLWLPYVSENLEALRTANREQNVSLGIVRPDPESIKFSWEKAEERDEDDRAIAGAMLHQQSLIEQELDQLAPPEFAFIYKYRSGDRESRGQIHDWEVQAAYRVYKGKYGAKALDMLKQMYQDTMKAQNLHLFLGTMKAHPMQFIIVGVLRTVADLAAIKKQSDLFQQAP